VFSPPVFAVLLFAMVTDSTFGQETAASSLAPEGEIAATVQKAQNSAVSIKTVSNTANSGWTRVGSGFLYQQHFVVTRRSVVDRADSIEIALPDGRSSRARLVHCDGCTEIAVLEHALDDVTPVQIGKTSGLCKGTPLTVLGNSFGIFPSVTLGRFLTKRQDGLIEIDGMIPPGNCGSPVLDSNGRLIGMIVGRFQDKREPSRVVGLAMPSETVQSFLCKIIKTPNARTGWIGVSVVDLTGTAGRIGVRVVGVTADGPAHQAEICVGDTIIRFQGNPIHSAQELASRVKDSLPDSKINFSIQRGKQETLRSVKVGRLPLFR
jgi:S1-C subfamily serine protease